MSLFKLNTVEFKQLLEPNKERRPSRWILANTFPFSCSFWSASLSVSCLRFWATSWVLIKPNQAKNSPYECGFEAFEDARMKFDVRYYLVAILFILFDLEIAFLFPWAAALRKLAWSDFLGCYCVLRHSGRGFRLRVEKRCPGLGIS